MKGLIEEIQMAALDRSIPIEDLLMRVKLAGAKLGAVAIEHWVGLELDGYKEALPEYRIVAARPMALNPYHGWVPIEGGLQLGTVFSRFTLPNPISALRHMVEVAKGDTIYLSVGVKREQAILKSLNVQLAGVSGCVSKSSLVSILEAVRSRALDWAIEMERQGVKGEGISFSPQEKERAESIMTTFNIGNIGNFAGNLGQGNVAGPITLNAQQITSVRDLIQQLRDGVPDLVRLGANEGLIKTVSDIDDLVQTSTPDRVKFSGLIQDARNAISGAAGGLMTNGAMDVIGRIAQAVLGA